MENLDNSFQENTEKQDKINEILDQLKLFSDSLDSNGAYEFHNYVENFKKDFEKDGKSLNDYALGDVLLKMDCDNVSNYNLLDTEDNQIEDFIKKITQK